MAENNLAIMKHPDNKDIGLLWIKAYH